MNHTTSSIIIVHLTADRAVLTHVARRSQCIGHAIVQQRQELGLQMSLARLGGTLGSIFANQNPKKPVNRRTYPG